MKILKWIWQILKDESGKGGDSTTITTTPAPTAEERELQKAQLDLTRQQMEEARRQSALFEQFAPMYQEQTRLQAQLAQQQITAQQEAMKSLEQYLKPSEQDILNQQIEGELLQRQLGYAKGEMPTLTPEQEAQLNEMTEIQKQQALSEILKQHGLGMQTAQDVSLARGLGSSSIRESLEDQIRQQSVLAGSQAAQGIENMRFNASWQMPKAQQTFEQGMSQFQSALNSQAQSNRQKLFGSLSLSNVNPFESIGSMMGMSVPGTYFGGDNSYVNEMISPSRIPVGSSPSTGDG